MGGQQSGCTRGKSYRESDFPGETDVVRVAPPELSPKQKQLLRNAWDRLERDIAQVGVITFVGMFKTHPQVQDYFLPFTGLSRTDEQYSVTLRSHALRVMATVEKCIHRLDEPDRMRNVLESLGARHTAYKAKIEYVDLLGSQFVKAVKDHTPEWTDELEAAWLSIVRIMTFYVKRGWMEKQRFQTKDAILQAEQSADRAVKLKRDSVQRSVDSNGYSQ